MADVLQRSLVNDPSPPGEFLAHVPAAVILTDARGTITYWNRRAEALYGWPRDEVLGRDAGRLLAGQDVPASVADVGVHVQAGESWEGELEVAHRDGRPVPIYAAVSPIRAEGPGQEVVGVLWMSFDISERKRIEQMQRAQYGIVRVLAEATSVEEAAPKLLATICRTLRWQLGAMWEVDRAAGRLRLVRLWHEPGLKARTFEKLTREVHFTPGVGLPGRVWKSGEPAWIPDVVADSNFPRAKAAAAASLHGAVAFPIRLRGKVLGVLEFFSSEVRPPDDQLLAMVAAVGAQLGQFIERQEAEHALRETEARRAAMLEASIDCVVAIDHEGRITEFNPAAERTFEYRRDEVLGRSMADVLIPPALRSRHRRGFARLLRTGKPRILGERLELEALRRDGSVFPVELTVNSVDRPGPPMFTASIRDISERRQAEEAKAELAAIVESSTDAIIGKTLDGVITSWNAGAQHMYGYGPDEVVGRPISLLVPPNLPNDVPEILERIRLGERVERRETLRTRKDGTLLDVELAVSPVRDRTGKLVGASTIARDITERNRARDRMAFLAEATRILSRSLDYRRTLRKVAKLVVPRLADWCSVDLMDEETGEIRQLAVAHVDPTKVKWARKLRKKYPPDPRDSRGVPHVIRTGRSELYPEIPDELIEDLPDPDLRRIVRELDLRSVMTVPLKAGRRTFGAITFVWAESGRRYSPGDLAPAEELAARAAQAIENARLYQERDHAARTLQESLLPPEMPEIRGMQIASRYLPAGARNEVGGDFYDVFDTGDGNWAVAIGDVCGKGPAAAAVMGLARYTLRAAAMRERRPSAVLEVLNEAIRRQSTDGRFITVCYARLRPGTRRARLTVSCGGHPPPVILRADGTQEMVGRPGTLLGLFPDPALSDQTVDLGPGDAVVMFTDGVTDAPPSEEEAGEQRLSEVLAGAKGKDAEGIAEAIDQHILSKRGPAARDDMALLVLRVQP